MYVICLHSGDNKCAKTEQSSYRLGETKNKQCSSCILMTKLVTWTNYYDTSSDQNYYFFFGGGGGGGLLRRINTVF